MGARDLSLILEDSDLISKPRASAASSVRWGDIFWSFLFFFLKKEKVTVKGRSHKT